MCLILSMIFVQFASANNMIDLEDILDDKFMPGSFLVIGSEQFNNESIKEEAENSLLDGSFYGAYNTMGFHR